MTVNLNGITDGDENIDENIEISVQSADPSIVTVVSVSDVSESGEASIVLNVGEIQENVSVEIFVTITDDCDVNTNGGNVFTELSFTVSVESKTHVLESQLSSFNVYPNPVTNVLKIDANHGVDAVEIVSIEGRRIIQKQVLNQNEFEIYVSDLLPGIYTLNTYRDNKLIANGKFVKK